MNSEEYLKFKKVKALKKHQHYYDNLSDKKIKISKFCLPDIRIMIDFCMGEFTDQRVRKGAKYLQYLIDRDGIYN